MALDGIFIRHIASELRENLLGGRISQIYQPNRDELVLVIRTFSSSKKLLISARANSPRVNLTSLAPENPSSPPMFCMLLRKKLGSGKLTSVRQIGSERIIFFDFETVNELGDCVNLTLAAEIMGKYSNIILISDNGLIIDSLKRVDITMSSMRPVLPNLKYEMPPSQGKFDLLSSSAGEILSRVMSLWEEMPLNKALLGSIQGISPIVCREIESLAEKDLHSETKSVSNKRNRLLPEIERLADIAQNCSGRPYMVVRGDGKPLDFSFLEINQYNGAAQLRLFSNFSGLLDNFYAERDAIERMRVSAQDMIHLTATLIDRLSRKINTQRTELIECQNREQLRIYGDLIQANLYRIDRGSRSVQVENFYDENNALLTIPLNPAISPAANSQKYYKDYRKAKTREKMLKEQIRKAGQELEYMRSVSDEISRARSEKELAQIRIELMEQGFIKSPKGRQKSPAALPPLKYVTKNGFEILVGRNNRQNDILTLKTAAKNDIWFHTKNIHGSHAILVTGGHEPKEEDIEIAARLAAYHSKARDSKNVPVDYTFVRYVSKPQDSKPGMVIYVNQKTVYVDAFLDSEMNIIEK